MSAHTPEPWQASAGGTGVCDSEGFDIWTGILDDWQRHFPDIKHWARHPRASVERTEEEDLSNAARVVACVNACAGINPEAVPDLLSAAKEILEFEPEGGISCAEEDARNALRAAIAKAKDGAA